MVAMARDPQLPTHWFNILHDRPQYVTSAVSRSRLAGEVKAAAPGAVKPAGHGGRLRRRGAAAAHDGRENEPRDRGGGGRRTVRRLCAGQCAWRSASGANARIYYKYEGANLTGDHKLNTALPQASTTPAQA